MKNRLYRTILIYASLLITFYYIYPTIGWMLLSPETRQARAAQWKEEDSVYQEPNFFRDSWKSLKRWAQFDQSKVVTLGLDLQGGIHMVVGFDLTEEQQKEGLTEEYIQEMVLRRIERRIGEFEAKEPIIQKMGTNKIQIQLPGERDVERAPELIKKTAKLDFHLVAGSDETIRTFQAISKDSRFKEKFTPFLKSPRYKEGPFRVPPEQIDRVRDIVKQINETTGLLPEGKRLTLGQKPNPWDKEQDYELYLMEAAPMISGEGLQKAMAAPDEEHPPYYQILFSFAGTHANEFGELTEKNIGRNMAIVIDGVIVSAPTIQSKIPGSGRITGSFNGPQANDLAIALNSGSLPVPLREEYTGVVGASLGTDSIRQGVYASVFGLVAVVAFMIVYYHFGGLISCAALALNGLIMLAAFSYFRLTLTLPGIAGFVLTMGMAVDANVLIFERVREEIRNGKSLLAAIELGYKRATATILDANITTLIAALVLMQYGTGPIQGFGVALAIGICTSVYTALVVTKAIFDLINDRKLLTKLTMMSIIKPGTKIPFMEMRWKAFIVSGILIAVGIAAFFGRGPANCFGVDFAGGTSMIVRLDTDREVQVGEIRKQIDAAGLKNSVIQEYSRGAELSKNLFSLRTSAIEEAASADGSAPELENRIKQALAALAGDPTDVAKVKLEEVQSVGPAIGAQLRQDAVWAILYALIFMMAYVWFRYNFIFGATGIIALVHDSIIAVGMLMLIGGRIDMNVIAAILTIIGYSINDTVVVYDRIRENTRNFTGRDFNYMQILNMSINETLGRTLLTSIVTMLAVVMLYVFGGEVLRSFSFCLIVGIVVGTYSSIFIASALGYMWQTWWRKRKSNSALGKGQAGSRRRSPKSNEAKA